MNTDVARFYKIPLLKLKYIPISLRVTENELHSFRKCISLSELFSFSTVEKVCNFVALVRFTNKMIAKRIVTIIIIIRGQKIQL